MSGRKSHLIAIECLTALLFAAFIAPFYIVVISGFKSRFQVLTDVLGLPDSWAQIVPNLQKVLHNPNLRFWNSIATSLVITVISLAIISLFSAMAAWVLVRRKSRISMWLFLIYVAAMVIPFQVLMLPLVAWMRMVHEWTGVQMLRTYHGLIFAYLGFGCSLSIFLYHGFIKNIPLELEQAALIDGCSKPQIFTRIIFPILKPVTTTVLVLNGLWIWNDYLLPLLMLGTGNDIQTIPLAIAGYVGSFVKQWELIMLVMLLVIIPVIIIFLLAQKQIIRGMVEGSIK